MRSIKAIIAGCAFIIIVILLLQLLYIFVAVGYNALAKDFPLLNDISGAFRYIIGIPVFVIIMFIGGYITASILKMKANISIWLHCVTVALITAGGMMYSALENSKLTTTGTVVFILALVATTLGGLYWKNNSQIPDD